MAELYVVQKGSAENGKLVTWRGIASRRGYHRLCWEWLPLQELRCPVNRLGCRAWKVRRMDKATAEAWAKECKGVALLASAVEGLPEYAAAGRV